MKKFTILGLLVLAFSYLNLPEIRAASIWSKTLSKDNAIGICTIGDYVFANMDPGLYRSSDHGFTWELKGEGIGANGITSMYKRGNRLFAGVYEIGLMKSDDNGDTWQKCGSGIDGKYILGLSGNSRYLFATSTGFCQPDTGNVYRSSDEGETWTKINKGLNSCGQRMVYMIAATDDYVYVTTEAGPHRSLDDGENWYPTSYMPSSDCRSFYFQDGIYYVYDSYGTYKSIDEGNSWLKITDTVLSGMAFYNNAIYAIRAMGKDMYISIDNGINWRQITAPEVWELTGIAVSGDNLIASGDGPNGSGVYVSKLSDIKAVETNIKEEHDEIRVAYIKSEDRIHVIFPIPTYGIKLSLWNAQGANIITKEILNSSDAELDASNLPSGLYFIKIQRSDLTNFSKVCIVKS